MAKRFIDPDWKILRTLSDEMQRAWFYIWDKADASGVYHYDPEYLKLDLRLVNDISLEQLGNLPECEILPGSRILIKNFLIVNYVALKPNYNPHKPAFRDIDKNGLSLNSSLNQACFKLEEEGEDEDKEEDKDFGKSENLFEPVGIVPQMVSQFKQLNPKYPEDRERDFAAVREIAEKIAKWEGLPAEITDPGVTDHIKLRWGELVNHAKADGHLSRYSLTQINKHFQSIVQSFTNGQTHIRNNSTGAKLGTSEARIKTAERWGR